MVRKRIVLLASALLALPALTPSTAHASLELNSSMTAACVSTDCSTVRFFFSAEAPVYVSQMTWTRLAGIFSFANVSGDQIANSHDEVWTVSGTSTGGIQLRSMAGNDLLEAPLWWDLKMTGVTNASQLIDAVRYEGNGYGTVDEYGSGQDPYYSTGGTVTPEPVSMLLLGSGLAGVAGVRRRKRSQVEEPTA